MLSFERLKELKAEFEQVRKYNDRHCMSTVTEDDVIEVLDEAIARQSVKSEDVAEAIEWQVSLKDYHQNKWEKAVPEWQEEPGAQAQHNEMMKAIDLAITALQAYQPEPPKGE